MGGGETDRHAAQQAINAYFSRRDVVARDQPLAAPPTAPADGRFWWESGSVKTLEVAVDPDNIKRLLHDAIDREVCVAITGEKVDGTAYGMRRVWPTGFREGDHVPGTQYLYCRDAVSGDDRVFRVDLMTRVEIV